MRSIRATQREVAQFAALIAALIAALLVALFTALIAALIAAPLAALFTALIAALVAAPLAALLAALIAALVAALVLGRAEEDLRHLSAGSCQRSASIAFCDQLIRCHLQPVGSLRPSLQWLCTSLGGI